VVGRGWGSKIQETKEPPYFDPTRRTGSADKRHIKGQFKEHSRTIKGTLMESKRKNERKLKENSGNIIGKFKENQRKLRTTNRKFKKRREKSISLPNFE
jgi:hypothetical protein